MKATFKFEKEFNYIAEDSDGSQWLYINLPNIRKDGWYEGNSQVLYHVTFNLGDNWKESLHKINHETGELEKVKVLPNLPVDTKVLVKDFGDKEWKKRYFKRFNEVGRVVAFLGGNTSWSSEEEYHEHTWHEWKLPEE